MRVLHLLKTSEGGTWAFRQMRELVKSGVEVHVAMPLNGKLVDAYKEAGIIVHSWECSLGGVVSSCSKLREIVKRVAPDIIHSHLSCLDKSSPSGPTTSPSHFNNLGSSTLSL